MWQCTPRVVPPLILYLVLLPVGWADLKAHLVKIEDRDTGGYPFLSVSYWILVFFRLQTIIFCEIFSRETGRIN